MLPELRLVFCTHVDYKRNKLQVLFKMLAFATILLYDKGEANSGEAGDAEHRAARPVLRSKTRG